MTSAAQAPGPPLPPRVQALAFNYAPLRFMEACRRRYADVVMFRTAENATCVIVFDSQLMKQMLRRTHDEVRIGDAQAQLLLAAGSVIGLEDAEHRERRRMLAPPFQ